MWRRPLQKSRRPLTLIKINLIQVPTSNKILSYNLLLSGPPLQNNSSTSCLQSWTMYKGLALSKPQCICIPWCIHSSSQSLINDYPFFFFDFVEPLQLFLLGVEVVALELGGAQGNSTSLVIGGALAWFGSIVGGPPLGPPSHPYK